MRGRDRRHVSSARLGGMAVRTLALAAGAAVILAAAVTPALAAIPNPFSRSTVPGLPSAIGISSAGYKAANCTGCHSSQAVQLDSNHGVNLRPVASTVGAASFNPYFGTFPGGDFALNQVNWIEGGLAIGSELYIVNGSGTVGVNAFAYPRLGNMGWFEDYPGTTQILGGKPAIPSVDATAWLPYAPPTSPGSGAPGDFFTGTAAGFETSADYGCIRCHSYGATITNVPPGVPSYSIQEFGVTCGNCHAPNSAHPFGNPTAIVAPFGSFGCYNCHQATPVAASTESSARPQQVAMEIWDSGQARTQANQGWEADRPRSVATTVVPGVVETTSGAGHSNSWDDVKSTFGGSVPEGGRSCMRCHSTLGYIAHSVNGTDVPFSVSLPSAFGGNKTYQVTTSTATNDRCAVCHPSHGNEQGLNQVSRRAASDMEVCDDCHRNPDMTMLEATSTAVKDPLSDTNVRHPQREMYFGYSGYGVANEPALHTLMSIDGTTGVACQKCHMPVTTDVPTSDSSHLFRIVMPKTTKTGVTVGWSSYPAGATTTSPVAQAPAVFPDDSCTGMQCHPQTDSTRDFLQTTIETRQGAILSKLAQAEALRQQASNVASLTTLYAEARTDQMIVQHDGSYGIHNYPYANDLLTWAIGTYQSLIASPPAPTVVPVDRLQGPDRYATSIAISRSTFPTATTAAAVIVNGKNFPDALSASGLAGAVRGPVLLTDGEHFTTPLSNELHRLGVTHIYVLAGTTVVTPDLVTGLATVVGAGNVERIWGQDRYDTSAAVARKVALLKGASFAHTVFLATGTNFPDAMSASPYAYGNAFPVLLTRPGALPGPVATALGDLSVNRVTIAGGTGAIANSVASAVEAVTGAGSSTRVNGQDRYNTATLMANFSTANGWATQAFVGVASGETFADALSGGAATGFRGGVLVLVGEDEVPPTTSSYLANYQPLVKRAAIFGGPGAVSEGVRAQVYGRLNP